MTRSVQRAGPLRPESAARSGARDEQSRRCGRRSGPPRRGEEAVSGSVGVAGMSGAVHAATLGVRADRDVVERARDAAGRIRRRRHGVVELEARGTPSAQLGSRPKGAGRMRRRVRDRRSGRGTVRRLGEACGAFGGARGGAGARGGGCGGGGRAEIVAGGAAGAEDGAGVRPGGRSSGGSAPRRRGHGRELATEPVHAHRRRARAALARGGRWVWSGLRAGARAVLGTLCAPDCRRRAGG